MFVPCFFHLFHPLKKRRSFNPPFAQWPQWRWWSRWGWYKWPAWWAATTRAAALPWRTKCPPGERWNLVGSRLYVYIVNINITSQTYKYILIWICIYIYMYKHVPISEVCKYACRYRCISIRMFLHFYMHTWVNKPLYRPIDLKWCYTVWDQCIFCALEKKRPGWYHLPSWLFAYWNRHGSLGWLNTIHDDHHEIKIIKIVTITPQ